MRRRKVPRAYVNFTKNLGQFLAQRGIRVNTVAPGPVWTPLIPATMPSEKVESFGQQVPMGRIAQLHGAQPVAQPAPEARADDG